MSFHLQDSIELEATLAICSEHPDAIMRKVGEITFLDEYRLVPGAAKLIHDTYFDTESGALATAKWALRVREIDERHWITLKGPAKPADSGGVRRVEIELPLSTAALEEVLSELSGHRLIGADVVKVPNGHAPREALAALGFRTIQDRETRRQIRYVFSPEGELLAEMALDTVTYRLSTGPILHEEIEIEAKAPGGGAAVSAILDHLSREFASQVRTWDFGKLATGLALERLVEKGRAHDLIASDGHLTPVAYGNIAILLE